jgi:DNA polymerase III epsilon subunit-like protein
MNPINQPNLVLCFDTETTGLFKKNKNKTVLEKKELEQESEKKIDENPHILQFSWCIYDTNTNAILKMVDEFICVSDEVIISDEITNFTGVTRAKCNTGISIIDALKMFYEDYQHCGIIIGHNVEFDIKMVRTEYYRHSNELSQYPISDIFLSGWLQEKNIKIKCTQMIGKNLCKLVMPNRSGYKFPKLVELYEFLFHEKPENLHNSMIDILVCLRCFLKMQFQFDVEPELFHKIIDYYMKSVDSSRRAELLNAKIGFAPFYKSEPYIAETYKVESKPKIPFPEMTTSLENNIQLPLLIEDITLFDNTMFTFDDDCDSLSFCCF